MISPSRRRKLVLSKVVMPLMSSKKPSNRQYFG